MTKNLYTWVHAGCRPMYCISCEPKMGIKLFFGFDFESKGASFVLTVMFSCAHPPTSWNEVFAATQRVLQTTPVCHVCCFMSWLKELHQRMCDKTYIKSIPSLWDLLLIIRSQNLLPSPDLARLPHVLCSYYLSLRPFRSRPVYLLTVVHDFSSAGRQWFRGQRGCSSWSGRAAHPSGEA